MIIEVKVLPKSSRAEIIKLGDNLYKVKLTKPREKGKANKELIKLLAKHFKTSQTKVLIKRGEKRARKIIEIR